jgi:polyketide synthase 12/myxalamid-type polyketide synthase MxaB
METLGMLLRARSARAAVLPVDWSQVARSFPGGQPPAFLSGLTHEFTASLEPTTEWVELSKRVAAAPAAERKDLVVQRLLELGRVVLGLRTTEALDAKSPLNELGFDSLMAVELANTLGRSAGKSFSATLLFDYPTFDALADYLLVEALAPGSGPQMTPEQASASPGGGASHRRARVSLAPH